MREAKFCIFRHDKMKGGHWYLEITSHRHGKNWFVPSQPKIDLAKLTGLNNVLRMSVTSLVYSSSPCDKLSCKVKFLHLRLFYLMPTKEKFYEYVRNATHVT